MIYLNDPLSFKEAFLISLEVLSNDKYVKLKEFIESIPSTINQMNLAISKEMETSLKSCISEVKKTKTYYWLREDFKNVINEIERQQYNKKVS